MKQQLKVIAKHKDTTFGEPDCVLSQVSNGPVNSDPLHLGPNEASEKFWDNSSFRYKSSKKNCYELCLLLADRVICWSSKINRF